MHLLDFSPLCVSQYNQILPPGISTGLAWKLRCSIWATTEESGLSVAQFSNDHAVLISRTIKGTKEGKERLDRDHQFFDHSNPEGMRIREEVDIL